MATPEMPEVGVSGFNVTVEDIIAMAVRAAQVTEKARHSNSEIAALVPEFSGSANEDVVAWFQRISTAKEIYNVPDKVMTLIVVSKLTNAAKNWFHSRPEYAALSLNDLKFELTKMFACREDRISMMRRFEERKWKKGEKFATYFHEKVLLGNKLKLEECDLIMYVIEGFDNYMLQTQAKLKEFRNLPHMLELMNEVTNNERSAFVSNAVPPRRSPLNVSTPSRSPEQGKSLGVRCYNCGRHGHLSMSCSVTKQQRGSCFQCGETGHHRRSCPKSSRGPNVAASPTTTSGAVTVVPADSTALLVQDAAVPAYRVPMTTTVGSSTIELQAVVDSGSPISLMLEGIIPGSEIQPCEISNNFEGVNGSKLNILGQYSCSIKVADVECINIKFYIVPVNTMRYECLLGRDFIADPKLKISFGQTCSVQKSDVGNHPEFRSNDVLLVDCDHDNNLIKETLNINENLSNNDKMSVVDIYENFYVKPERPDKPATKFESSIVVVPNHTPFFFRPRRLSYFEKEEVNKIVNELLVEGIVRKSSSQYSSPIVLVKRKNGTLRMCVDFRSLNKITIRDNYPLPLIDDCLDGLRGKNYFTKLDLKNAFYHVSIQEESIKYMSFVTPMGQFEYTRLPFGFRNSPAIFMRFINLVFQELLENKEIMVYIDDILIATESINDNLRVLCKVFKLLVENKLTLRLDKCSFLYETVEYLGYVVDRRGIKPNPENLRAVKEFPLPRGFKEVHSFLGLVSYFRRFIESFSTIAKPLYDLLRKDAVFVFGPKQLSAFDRLKDCLASQPLLCLYSPQAETQLHCDASSLGFGAILLQRQADKKFHPVLYFSKRTSEAESKYHSFELEVLAIVYALQRFKVYLQGIKFTIFTDCNSLKLALQKKEVNPRILRWSLVLQNFNYSIEHRNNAQMKHADALSRCYLVMVVSENSFDRNLAICQAQDDIISEIALKLENREDKLYELRNGVVYRKNGDKILFYVPESMVSNVIRTCHDDVGHVGVEKVMELVRRQYWFPQMKQKIIEYVSKCLKCIIYSPSSGKSEGLLHNIPKGKLPFNVIHIDHCGPFEKTRLQNKYIFVIVDAFTKFVRLYSCRTVTSRETIKCLLDYFRAYSRPGQIISDRGSAFTSQEFEEFLSREGICHSLIATGVPRANGQVERVNRVITPMLAKICIEPNKWDSVLSEVEYNINNTICKSTGYTPSTLLYGLNQNGKLNDSLKMFLELGLGSKDRENLLEVRENASAQIQKNQEYNKAYYDKTHKAPNVYKEGDLVMITNHDVTVGVNKKLIPKYKGPYMVHRVLSNDRYVITDVDGFQHTRVPFNSVFDPANMRPWPN